MNKDLAKDVYDALVQLTSTANVQGALSNAIYGLLQAIFIRLLYICEQL